MHRCNKIWSMVQLEVLQALVSLKETLDVGYVAELLEGRTISRGTCVVIQEQRGSLPCPACKRLFKSAGGLGIHKNKLLMVVADLVTSSTRAT